MKIAALALLLTATLPAAANPDLTLRDLVQDIALQYPRTELAACGKAYPEQDAEFAAALSGFHARITRILDTMAPEQPALAIALPPAFSAFQAMQSALADDDFRTRSPTDCEAVVRELEALKDEELKAGLSESAGRLERTIRSHNGEMERVMGIEPTS